jgi:hypothetical protein
MWRTARHFLVASLAFALLSLGLTDSDIRFSMRLVALMLAVLFTFIALIETASAAEERKPLPGRRSKAPMLTPEIR